jgi:hypothetical protein
MAPKARHIAHVFPFPIFFFYINDRKYIIMKFNKTFFFFLTFIDAKFFYKLFLCLQLE